MSLFRHVRALLELASSTGDDHVGRTWLILPSDADQTPDHALEMRVWVQPAAAPAPEPPAPQPCPPEAVVGRPVPTVTHDVEPEERPLRVVIETSVDKVTWTRAHPPIAVGDDVRLTRVVVLGPYVRARTLGNGVAHGATVYLLSNGAFRLERV